MNTVLECDQSSIMQPAFADLTHLTGQFEANSSSVMEPAPPKFQIKMKGQSALDYIDDEVESIMSSASKYEPEDTKRSESQYQILD